MTKPVHLTLVLFGVLLTLTSAHAQTLRWVYQYGGPGSGSDEAWPMVLGSDGNLYAAGWSTGSGTGFDFTVVSVDREGRERWVYRYDGAGASDQAHGVVFGRDGNVYAAGSSTGASSSKDILVVSLDTAGRERWVYRYNGPGNRSDEARSCAFGVDGNVYAAGTSAGSGTGDDFMIVSVDTAGRERWVYRYNGPGGGADQAYARRMACGADGNVYAGGYSTGSTGPDYTVISVDSLGRERWVYRHDGPAHSEDMVWGVEFGPDGNVHTAGYLSGGDQDFACISLAPDGRERWVYIKSVSGRDQAWGLASDAKGWVYPGGELSVGENHNFAVVGLDSTGAEQWVYQYAGPYNDYVGPVHVGWDGRVYAAGKSYTTANDFGFVIASIDSATGDENWFYRYDGQGGGFDNGEAVLLAPDGDLYAAGSSTKAGSGQDITVLSLALPHSHDVGPTRIVAPVGSMDSGTPVAPCVVVHNFGTFVETFPLSIAIGTGYVHTLLDTLAAGATDTLEFPVWTAQSVGRTPVTAYTGLAEDENRGNDTLRDSVRITRPPFMDVGVIAIVAPNGQVDSGAAVLPRAVAHNFGTGAATFWISMRVGSSYLTMNVDTLEPGESDTVSFPSWMALTLGSFPVVCYTTMPGDMNPANDTLLDSVTVVRAASFDVAVIRIIAPTGTVDSASVVTPAAVVHNYGSSSAGFPVTMHVGTEYTRTVQDTLAPGQQDTVYFTAWTALPRDRFDVVCYTYLVGDEHPENDTARDTVLVVAPVRRDVGVTAILAPPESARPGTSLLPRARVRNFGNNPEYYFAVVFRIGTVYLREQLVARALLPDSACEVVFDPWVAVPGSYAVSCSTMLETDEAPSNDKLTSTLAVANRATLVIEPDQSDRIRLGEGKSYRYYAEMDGDAGDVVELGLVAAPTGWSCQLFDSADMNELQDTDADGLQDIDVVMPGIRRWFTLRVRAPSSLSGDTSQLQQAHFVIHGFLASDSTVSDTATLDLRVVPNLEIHNFPNPFGGRTTFVIGLPDDGEVSLTVYNRAGELIGRVIEHEQRDAGLHFVNWAAKNSGGQWVAPGVYQYVLEYRHQGIDDTITKKLVVTGR